MPDEAAAIELPDLSDDKVQHLSVGKVLRYGKFRYLWFSQILAQVAGHVLNFALVIKVYQLTGSNALVSVLVALVSLPPILFSSLAGVYADNFNRKTILLLSNAIRCVIALGLLLDGNSVTMLIVFAFCISTVSQFFGPAESSSIASLTHCKGYFSANSLFVFTTYTAFLVGYSVAGPALRFLGDTTTFSILILMFGLASVMNLLLPPIREHLEHKHGLSVYERAFNNIRKEMREGLHFIRGNRFLLVIVVLVSSIFAIERSVISLLPDLAQRTFRYTLDEISYFIITPAGVGAFLGAIIANWLKSRIDKTKIIITGMFIAAVTLMLFPLYSAVDQLAGGRTDLILFIALLAALSGFGDVFIIIAAQTLVHEETSSHTRGRVFGSLITLMNAVGLPLILIVGFLASRIQPVHIIFFIGFGLTLLVASALVIFRRIIRQGI